jgi:hypothetical protein
MFNGVGDCLLSNAIKMRGHHVVFDGDKPVATQFTVSLEKLCGIIRKLLATPSSSSDCLTQVRLGKTACNIPRFRHGVADAPQSSQSCPPVRLRLTLWTKDRVQHTPKLDPCEALAQIVMPSWPMRPCSRSLTATFPAQASLRSLMSTPHFCLRQQGNRWHSFMPPAYLSSTSPASPFVRNL